MVPRRRLAVLEPWRSSPGSGSETTLGREGRLYHPPMPELPEVETVRRILERHAAGRRVDRVDAAPVRMRRPLVPSELRAGLEGARLTGFRRRGKFLLVDTGRSGSLLVHLGMSGRLLLTERSTPRLAHTHLVLELDDGRDLRLVDPRRFGLASFLAPGAEAADPSLASLGLEPLADDLPRRLPSLLKPRRAPLKVLLLDQRIVAGVGNIYACEALWRAGVRPTRPPLATSVARLARLAVAVREVLCDAVAAGGTTIRDYTTPDGESGWFAVRLAVYGRAGEPCPRCGGTLRVEVLAQRSTFWCPGCQR